VPFDGFSCARADTLCGGKRSFMVRRVRAAKQYGGGLDARGVDAWKCR
jgi:hypothetical protein